MFSSFHQPTHIACYPSGVGYSAPIGGPPHCGHPDYDREQLATTPEDWNIWKRWGGWTDTDSDDDDNITDDGDITDDTPPLTGCTGASTDIANNITATATTTPEQPQLQAQANDDHNNHNDHNEDTDHQTAATTSATTTTTTTTTTNYWGPGPAQRRPGYRPGQAAV